MKGRLYLIPSPLGDNDPSEVIPSQVLSSLKSISHFAVEDVRTARRYLSKAGLKGSIESLSFYEISEHTTYEDAEKILHVLLDGNDVGLISEAGLPAVADPGAMLVELSHKHDIQIVPFVGPSSLMLALMSSGLNGQRFSFHGYIPIKTEERKAKLKEMERESKSLNVTQLFIETPYRNDSLLHDILSTCRPDTMLCIAADITLPEAFIKTAPVSWWLSHPVNIGKRPCVFLILA